MGTLSLSSQAQCETLFGHYLGLFPFFNRKPGFAVNMHLHFYFLEIRMTFLHRSRVLMWDRPQDSVTKRQLGEKSEGSTNKEFKM
jgi:hypothetical protein